MLIIPGFHLSYNKSFHENDKQKVPIMKSERTS